MLSNYVLAEGLLRYSAERRELDKVGAGLTDSWVIYRVRCNPIACPDNPSVTQLIGHLHAEVPHSVAYAYALLS